MIPADIKESLVAYREGNHPYPFGGFVTAVLANDLVGAFLHADDYNKAIMGEYAAFLYMEMRYRTGDPKRDVWGSYEAVATEIERQMDLAVK